MKVRRHWVVFVLPAILMIFIAVGGFIYLDQDESVSNEELQQEIDLTASLVDEQTVRIEWEWPQMPTEGIFGTDYIGLSFDGDFGTIEPGVVTLPVEPEQTFQGTLVENGVVFPFPTEMQDHQGVGTRGTIIQALPEYVNVEDIEISLLHTWTNHEELTLEDATFAEPQFGDATNVLHWVRTYEWDDIVEN